MGVVATRSERGDVYPAGKLVGSKTALILFAAAFGGRQDAVFIADAGLKATCIDIDPSKLLDMRGNYPDDWTFLAADVFDVIDATPERAYDVVSADPFTNDFDRTAARLPDLCLIARHTVILACGTDAVFELPYGWSETGRLWRSNYAGGVYWVILERG